MLYAANLSRKRAMVLSWCASTSSTDASVTTRPPNRRIRHAGLGCHDNLILRIKVVRESGCGFEDESHLVGNPALGGSAANAGLYFVG